MSAKRWTIALLMGAAAALLPSPAGAAPLRAAIVSAGEGEAATALPARLRAALQADSALAAIASGDLARALEGPLPADPEAGRASAAEDKLREASEAVARFDEGAALASLAAAETAVLALRPGRRTAELLGEIEFTRGQILFDQGKAEAAASFAAAHVLSPNRGALDPARFPPELIAAYRAARPVEGEPSSIKLSSPFDGGTIYLDGQPVAATPTVLRVSPGPHYLAVMLPDYAVATTRLVVGPRESVEPELRYERLPVTERAHRLRRALLAARSAQGLDAAEALSEARRAAGYTGADAVILVTDSPTSETLVYLYRSATDTLSAAIDASRTSVDALLAPLRPAVLEPPPPPPPPPADPWWRSRFVQASVAGGFVVGLVLVLASTLSGTSQLDTVNPSAPLIK